jgi:hypothetical protein
VEVFDKCSAACESGTDRNYRVTTLPEEKGRACKGPADCEDGEDKCVATSTTTTTTIFDDRNKDCFEGQDPCTAECYTASERNYWATSQAQHNGRACRGATDCVFGEGGCVPPPLKVTESCDPKNDKCDVENGLHCSADFYECRYDSAASSTGGLSVNAKVGIALSVVSFFVFGVGGCYYKVWSEKKRNKKLKAKDEERDVKFEELKRSSMKILRQSKKQKKQK